MPPSLTIRSCQGSGEMFSSQGTQGMLFLVIPAATAMMSSWQRNRSCRQATRGMILVVLLAAPCLGGCGTIGGLASDEYESKVYVGIRADVDACGQTVAHGVPGWLWFIWDMPCSLALDTLLLPGTLIYEAFRPRKSGDSKTNP